MSTLSSADRPGKGKILVDEDGEERQHRERGERHLDAPVTPERNEAVGRDRPCSDGRSMRGREQAQTACQHAEEHRTRRVAAERFAQVRVRQQAEPGTERVAADDDAELVDVDRGQREERREGEARDGPIADRDQAAVRPEQQDAESHRGPDEDACKGREQRDEGNREKVVEGRVSFDLLGKEEAMEGNVLVEEVRVNLIAPELVVARVVRDEREDRRGEKRAGDDPVRNRTHRRRGAHRP